MNGPKKILFRIVALLLSPSFLFSCEKVRQNAAEKFSTYKVNSSNNIICALDTDSLCVSYDDIPNLLDRLSHKDSINMIGFNNACNKIKSYPLHGSHCIYLPAESMVVDINQYSLIVFHAYSMDEKKYLDGFSKEMDNQLRKNIYRDLINKLCPCE